MTNSERDAGVEARMNATPDWQDEADLPGPVPAHECTSPDPERCLVCVLNEVVAMQKVREETIRERGQEWWEAS